MSILGNVCLEKYLTKVKGEVIGRVVTDGKDRYYRRSYDVTSISPKALCITPQGQGMSSFILPKTIPLDETLVAFFGLYSGDGAKGVESAKDKTRIIPRISLSQREPHLIAYAVEQFRRIFGKNIAFSFQLGEDSAYFMDGEGSQKLAEFYGGTIPVPESLNAVRPRLSDKDIQYLQEQRPNDHDNRECLAFYYQHKEAMEQILAKFKKAEIERMAISLTCHDEVKASVRRPFKKGARTAGGTSRSDELTLSGVNGLGEIFLKILHELEQSIYADTKYSPSLLIEWLDIPSSVGQKINVADFFRNSPYTELNGKRASITEQGSSVIGRWRNSLQYELKPIFPLDPLWCYVSGLYLAEGTTPKSNLFALYSNTRVDLAFGFTSTENQSIELVIRSLKKLFAPEECLNTWKIKVGSQYFPELVVIGLKNGVPMLRGGTSGDGKLRTMEISLSVKQWALEVAPCLNEYADKFSHVEPTGAGIPRIDISASSSVCKWYFPLLMYAVFGDKYPIPSWR